MRWAVIALASLAAVAAGAAQAGGGLVSYEIVGDAVPAPLGGLVGDAERGKAIVRDRRVGNCLICHTFPIDGERFQGELGPLMDGVGSRLSEGQIRLRLIDPTRLNPDALMPAYYRVDGLNEVAPDYVGKPVLDAQQIEDVVQYLTSLTNEP